MEERGEKEIAKAGAFMTSASGRAAILGVGGSASRRPASGASVRVSFRNERGFKAS